MVSEIPIAVDESLTDPESLADIIQNAAADVLIIKPTLTGGIKDIKKIIQIAKTEDLRLVFSSSFETHIAQLFTLHILGSLNIKEHCGLFNVNLFDDFIPEIKKDQCFIPSSPGIGCHE